MEHLTFSNFFSNYIRHPLSPALSKTDRKVAMGCSIALGLLFAGTPQLGSQIAAWFRNCCCTKKPSGSKVTKIFEKSVKQNLPSLNATPNPSSHVSEKPPKWECAFPGTFQKGPALEPPVVDNPPPPKPASHRAPITIKPLVLRRAPVAINKPAKFDQFTQLPEEVQMRIYDLAAEPNARVADKQAKKLWDDNLRMLNNDLLKRQDWLRTHLSPEELKDPLAGFKKIMNLLHAQAERLYVDGMHPPAKDRLRWELNNYAALIYKSWKIQYNEDLWKWWSEKGKDTLPTAPPTSAAAPADPALAAPTPAAAAPTPAAAPADPALAAPTPAATATPQPAPIPAPSATIPEKKVKASSVPTQAQTPPPASNPPAKPYQQIFANVDAYVNAQEDPYEKDWHLRKPGEEGAGWAFIQRKSDRKIAPPRADPWAPRDYFPKDEPVEDKWSRWSFANRDFGRETESKAGGNNDISKVDFSMHPAKKENNMFAVDEGDAGLYSDDDTNIVFSGSDNEKDEFDFTEREIEKKEKIKIKPFRRVTKQAADFVLDPAELAIQQMILDQCSRNVNHNSDPATGETPTPPSSQSDAGSPEKPL